MTKGLPHGQWKLRLDPHFSSAGALYDTGPCPFLRWHGQQKERSQHVDDELLLRLNGAHLVGDDWLFIGPSPL